MREILVIVAKKKTVVRKIMNIALFVLACLLFVLAMGAPVLTIPAIVVAVLWYFQGFHADFEFEYTYYDGDLRFARIRSKSRRKSLGIVQMDDVIKIAPKGDRSVYKYENDSSMTYKNLSSGEPGARVYELIFKGEKGLNRYEFEPDDEMLDAIMVKYPRSVVR